MSYQARPGIIGTIKSTFLGHEANRKSRLLAAIVTNNEAEAIRLIRDTGMTPADLNNENPDFAFMAYAIQNNQLAVVKELIAAGADLNFRHAYHGPGWVFNLARSKWQIDDDEWGEGLGGAANYFSTPYALSEDNPDIRRVLVAAGAYVPPPWRRRASASQGLMSEDKLNRVPITEREFNLEHDSDPIKLDPIGEGAEYYMMNDDRNPYEKESMISLLESNDPKSPTTRQPIREIRRHIRPKTASGGRKRTRRQGKSKRKTRNSRK